MYVSLMECMESPTHIVHHSALLLVSAGNFGALSDIRTAVYRVTRIISILELITRDQVSHQLCFLCLI
jgi:hypothetical protein